MNKKYIAIIGIVVSILLLSSFSFYLNRLLSSSQKKKQNIDNFTIELFTIINALNNAKCITPSLKLTNETIVKNHLEAQKIIAEVIKGGKAASPESITKYNEAYTKYTQAYSKLTECSSYCPQADISSGNCVCPPNYPIPVQIGNKLYCTNEDCTNIPNSVFVPSSSSDPSQNKCDCITGFTKDPNGGSYCYSISSSNSLNTYTDNINSTFAQISNLQPLNVYGTYKNSLNIISQSDVPPSTPISTIPNVLSSITCADECIKNINAGSFAFDLSNQTCNLYATPYSISSLASQNGSKVVGTKNLSITPSSV